MVCTFNNNLTICSVLIQVLSLVLKFDSACVKSDVLSKSGELVFNSFVTESYERYLIE